MQAAIRTPGTWDASSRPLPLRRAARTHSAPFLPIVLQALCFTGTRLMAGRKPFALAGALAAWNLLLAVFSTVGFLRTAPHLLVFLRRDGFYASVRRRV